MKITSSNSGRNQSALVAFCFALTVLSLSPAAIAQHPRGEHARRGQHQEHGQRATPHRWHGNIARFHEHDWHLWRGGHWTRARHGGRLGWWWVVGGAWYFYPSPVYPYPNPWEPSTVIVTPPTAIAPQAPPAEYWYYCEASEAYYPYVTFCPGGWKQVPARPIDSPPPTQN